MARLQVICKNTFIHVCAEDCDVKVRRRRCSEPPRPREMTDSLFGVTLPLKNAVARGSDMCAYDACHEDATTCSTMSSCGGASSRENSPARVSEMVTTMMICNIPCRITEEDFAKLIDTFQSGAFVKLYDFLHLPHIHGRSKGNLGYGFINFTNELDAERFATAFHGYKIAGVKSDKVLEIRPAHVQGLAANTAQFKKRRFVKPKLRNEVSSNLELNRPASA